MGLLSSLASLVVSAAWILVLVAVAIVLLFVVVIALHFRSQRVIKQKPVVVVGQRKFPPRGLPSADVLMRRAAILQQAREGRARSSEVAHVKETFCLLVG
jgi:hypothetical protein